MDKARSFYLRIFEGSIPFTHTIYSRVEKRSSRHVHNLEIVGSNPTPAPIMLPLPRW